MDYLPKHEPLMDEKDILALNSLVLAFVGDTVQQLAVRTRLATESTAKAGELHKRATAEIKATAQAAVMDRLLPYLTEEEEAVYRRTRNTKLSTVAKNASISDYRKASAFEAVIGYLYLLGRNERLSELMKLSMEDKEEK